MILFIFLTGCNVGPVPTARLSYAQELIERESNQPQQHRLSLQRKRKAKKVNLGSSVTKESVTLTFVTLEERMRRLRQQSKGSNGPEHRNAEIIEGSMVPGRSGLDLLPQESSRDLFVDMNFLYQTIFVSLREPDPTDPPHKIINRSSRWNVSYVSTISFIYESSFSILTPSFTSLNRYTTDKGRAILTHGSVYRPENQHHTHGKNHSSPRNCLFVLVLGNGAKQFLAKTTVASQARLKCDKEGHSFLLILLRMKSKVILER